jgi:hypothetical protein
MSQANDAGAKKSGSENRDAADKATQENTLSTGHNDPEDGGADNARPDDKSGKT